MYFKESYPCLHGFPPSHCITCGKLLKNTQFEKCGLWSARVGPSLILARPLWYSHAFTGDSMNLFDKNKMIHTKLSVLISNAALRLAENCNLHFFGNCKKIHPSPDGWGKQWTIKGLTNLVTMTHTHIQIMRKIYCPLVIFSLNDERDQQQRGKVNQFKDDCVVLVCSCQPKMSMERLKVELRSLYINGLKSIGWASFFSEWKFWKAALLAKPMALEKPRDKGKQGYKPQAIAETQQHEALWRLWSSAGDLLTASSPCFPLLFGPQTKPIHIFSQCVLGVVGWDFFPF